LSNLKSFRESRKKDLISFDQEIKEAIVYGKVKRGELETDFSLQLSPQEKKMMVNGKTQQSFQSYLGLFLVNAFHPGDLRLVEGGPQDRRQILDRLIFQHQLSYLEIVTRYNKALKSRNALLKSPRSLSNLEDEFSIWEARLASYGVKIIHERGKMIGLLSEEASKSYGEIASKSEELRMEYKASGGESLGLFSKDSLEEDEGKLREALRTNRSKDYERGFTGVGPHRDDIALYLKDHPMKHTASQGQKRTAVLAWKLGEVELWKKEKKEDHGQMPVLLIDDLSSELDRYRRSCLSQLIVTYPSQVFVTSTEKNFPGSDQGSLKEEKKTFQVDEGRYSELED
jgi:DNA replication and repair protein RecF